MSLNCSRKLVETSGQTLNRWINGKCPPKSLTSAEDVLLRKMLPEPPPHHPDYAFRFIDKHLLASGGYEKALKLLVVSAFLPVNGIKRLCTYKASWFNDKAVHKFNLDIRK